MIKKLILPIVFLGLLSACGTKTINKNITDPSYTTKSTATDGATSVALDYRDFEFAASKAIESFLKSPVSTKPNSNQPWVMAISRIKNDTTISLDTDQLVKKIRIALLNSGKVITTTAVGAGGAEDELSKQIRDLQKSQLFDQTTVAKNNGLIAPDLSLSGKIIQRTNLVGSSQQNDYYIQLSITNINTGLAFWEFEQIISKLTSKNSFTWNP